MIDQPTIDRMLDAANIVDVVSEFVTLRKRGINYVGLCPFHSDKSPSFYVSPSKNICKCFACGEGGTAVHFIMKHEQLSYFDALRFLAKKYNIEIQERELTEKEKQIRSDRESMLIVNSWAGQYFSTLLHEHVEGKSVGMRYFAERGLREDIIRKFQLGYSLDQRDALYKTAIKAGYKKEFLEKTGLVITYDNGNVNDRFRGRVIFPVHTLSGKVVAFGGRVLKKDEKTAKYVNSPESEIYHKSNELYGIYFAKRAITQQDCCILVEGYTDVISMHQSGIENVVASSGTSLTDGQIRLIGRFTRNVTVIYDGDSAGIKASLRRIDMILKDGLNVRVVLLPDGDDPDSFARKHNATELRDFILSHEEDFISFKTRLLLAEAAGDPLRKAALIADIVQSISVIPDAITRSVYTRECSRQMEIDEQILLREIALRRVEHTAGNEAKEFIRNQEIIRRRTENQPAAIAQVEAGSSIEELENELIKYLLKYGEHDFEYVEGKEVVELNVAEVIINDLDQNGIVMKNAVLHKIYEEYKTLRQSGEEIGMNHFINHPDPEVSNAVVNLLTYDDNYMVSKLWKKFDIVVESEQERLPVAVPRAVILYKSKVIDDIIAGLRAKLADQSLPEEEQATLTHQISVLNQERTLISKKLSRLIV